MINFTQIQVVNCLKEKFHYIRVLYNNNTLSIILNRPTKKNALCPKMMDEIAFALCYAHYTADVRLVVIRAIGDVFCAGADLKAFAGDIEPHESSIPEASGEVLLGDIFHTVHKPCIAVIEGDVYAGGLFFLAGCHYVFSLDNVKLGLPEVKRGLFPFQVMAALLEVMPTRIVIDWCLQGYNLPVATAFELGLVTHISTKDNLQKDILQLSNVILGNSPTAIRNGLSAFDLIRKSNTSMQLELKNLLKATITSKDAQEGLTAFKEKRKPNWTGE